MSTGPLVPAADVNGLRMAEQCIEAADQLMCTASRAYDLLLPGEVLNDVVDHVLIMCLQLERPSQQLEFNLQASISTSLTSLNTPSDPLGRILFHIS